MQHPAQWGEILFEGAFLLFSPDIVCEKFTPKPV